MRKKIDWNGRRKLGRKRLNLMKLQIDIETCLPYKCEIKYHERTSLKVLSLKMELIPNTGRETERI